MSDPKGLRRLSGSLCRVVILFSVLLAPLTGVASSPFDLIIRSGVVLDGSGAPAFQADVAVRDGRIAAIGNLSEVTAPRIIDATGLYVTPGFIDLHSHAEDGLANPFLASAVNLVTQGITTVVVGQDGVHAWPVGGSLSAQAAQWRGHGVGVNVVPLAGFAWARQEVLGRSREAATPEEERQIASRIRAHLAQGAWGLSSGLEFTPSVPSSEVIAAVRLLSEIDGFYISHLRDQGDHFLEALDELVSVGEATGVRVVVTHISTRGHANWGAGPDAVARLSRARSQGVRVYADLTPYRSGGGSDVQLVPGRFRPVTRETPVTPELLEAINQTIADRGGPERLRIDQHPDERLLGRTLNDVPGSSLAQAALDLTIDGARFTQVQISENDIVTFIAQPFVAASSDGWVVKYGLEQEHPRSYGAFAKRIRRYVYELQSISLPFAIRAATGLTAEIVGLEDRGLLEVGKWADLLILDAPRFRDRSTYRRGHQYCEGLEWVLVNGTVALAQGIPTGHCAGKVLLKTPQGAK